MSSQYDSIGTRYNNIKALPVASIELHSVRSALGDISGLRCLDLACGVGYYSQKLVGWGAAHVVGVDISAEMVKGAQEACKGDSRLEFFVGDCADPRQWALSSREQQIREEKGFDLVLGAWLLNYASSEAELLSMWRNIHCNLKPGGRFVGITPNMSLDMSEPLDDRYGITARGIQKVEHGWKVRLTVYTAPKIEFETYHLNDGVYETTAAAAGMEHLEWENILLPDGEKKDSGYWDEFVRRPHAGICTAVRPRGDSV